MRLWERLAGRSALPARRDRPLGLDEWASWFEFGGTAYPMLQTTMSQIDHEQIIATASGAYRSNGPIFALVLARMQVFSQARFQWTRFVGGQPTDLFGSPDLQLLERPWPGGTTSDLLARMELHASLAGTAFVRRTASDRVNVLRPDWTTVILGSQEDAPNPSQAGDVELAGFVYDPPSGQRVLLLPEEMALYAPIPDPDFNFLGMSWITPVIREMQADGLATEHKARFFQNAAPQPLDAKILTPRGWSTMGEMAIGSDVIGSDGHAHKVSGVFPQGIQDIYRVTFSDGATAECTEDHLWQVANAYDRQRGMYRVLSLRELIADGLKYKSGPAKWAVPFVEPVQFDTQAPLPVAPYLLGLLLGDGSFRGNGKGSGGVSLAVAAEDVEETETRLAPMLPAEVSITRRDRGGWSEFYFRGRGGPSANPLTGFIRDLGLWGVPGPEKFIPEAYLRGGLKDRVALLQGLIDSDGHVASNQGNVVRFTTTSSYLAEQLADLVGSLGGSASVRPVIREAARPQWTVHVKRLPDWVVPCRLVRKVARYSPLERGGRWRYIVSAEFVDRRPAQCIRVEVADHLYVTDDFVLTHNTPNMAIKFDPSVSVNQVKEFRELMEEDHRGVFDAYKTLYLGGGADPSVIGMDFKQMDFSATQGKGESRLAAAAGVPPSWVGFSEGLQGSSLNAGNFTAARRRFSDGTMMHLWTNAAASLESILTPPDPHASLWFDTRAAAFMREDAGELATIQSKQATTITALVRDGFTPESAVDAVNNNDWSRLRHTGLTSIQLVPPSDGKEPQAALITDGAPPGPSPAPKAAGQPDSPADPKGDSE